VVTVNVVGEVILEDLTISGGAGAANGGGIYNAATDLILRRVVVTGNTAQFGAGIFNDVGGVLTIEDSTVESNVASKAGGGIRNETDALLAARRVAVLDNSATLAFDLGYGGGLANRGAASFVNSTFSGNHASKLGGAGFDDSGASTEITSSTVSGNHSGFGGALFNYSGATFDLTATIVAGNTAADSTQPDCQAAVVSGGSNLIGIGDVCTGVTDGLDGDQVGTAAVPIDPLLGPVQDNGGPTYTMALAAGSPAYDAAVCPDGVTTDQRGLPRPQDAACDAGAFELWLPSAGNPGPQAVDEDGTLKVAAPGLLPSDSGTVLSVEITDPVDFGTLTIAGDGSFEYLPVADFAGSDGFTYRVTDGAAYSDPVTVTITVNAVNDPPSFVAGGDVAVAEDSGPYTGQWASAISPGPADEAGQSVTFSVNNSNPGLFSAQPAIDATGVLRFTPAPNAVGAATVSVTATDTGGGTDTSGSAGFVITVNAVNDPPSFVPGGDVTVAEDSGPYAAQWASAISPGPVDEAGQGITFSVNNSNPGLFSAQPAIDATGVLRFTPVPNASGVATVSVSASDTGGGTDTSGTAGFVIAVSAVNDAPVGVADGPFAVFEGGSVSGSVLGNDFDVDSVVLSAVVVSGPSHGVVSMAPDGTFTYTHDGSETTSDSFSYVVSDGELSSAPVVVSLAVTAVLDGPVLLAEGVGLVDPSQGRWWLRGGDGSVSSFFFGNPGDFPIFGDWDCDGVDTPGMYRQSDGYVYLRNSNSQGVADVRFFFGDPGDVPLAGDFDGDGCDTVSIYRPAEGRFYIIDRLGSNDGGLGAASVEYLFGNPGDKPFVGDFDGDGIDTVGLHRESTGFVYFRQSHTQGVADAQFFFGDPGDRIVAADWNADGTDSPGLFRPSLTRFFLRYSNTQGNADADFTMGESTWLPIAGNFGG
jgi:hypothetical protein